MRNPRYSVEYRRKREGKTDYRKRLKLIQSHKTRLIVRPFSRSIIAQAIQYEENGDKVLLTVGLKELQKAGWTASAGNVPAAYLTGYLLGKKALTQNIHEMIVDTGVCAITKGSRIFGCVKGVIDAGIHIPHGEDMFPSEERLHGTHIDAYRKTNLKKMVAEVKVKIT